MFIFCKLLYLMLCYLRYLISRLKHCTYLCQITKTVLIRVSLCNMNMSHKRIDKMSHGNGLLDGVCAVKNSSKGISMQSEGFRLFFAP